MQTSNQLSIPAAPVFGAANPRSCLRVGVDHAAWRLCAEGPAIPEYFTKSDIQIARDVAQYVYFHENEHNWPDTYENFLGRSNLRRRAMARNVGNSRVLDATNLFRLLQQNRDGRQKHTYLDVDESLYAGNSDLSRAPIYVRVLNRGRAGLYQRQ